MRSALALAAGAALLALGGALWLLAADDERTTPGDGDARPTSEAAAARGGAAGGVLRARPAPERDVPALPAVAGGPEVLPPSETARAPVAPQPSGFVVSGHVRRASGDALPGALVELHGSPGADGTEPVLASTRTPDDGNFRVDTGSVRPAAVVVTWRAMREVLDEGSAWDDPVSRLPVVVRLELPAGKVLPPTVVVTVDTGWTLSGKITDAQGQALEGAFAGAGKDGPEAHTGPDGSFVLQDIERLPTPIAITAWAPFRTREVVALAAPPADVWKAGQDFRLSRAGSVSGFVIDAEGHSLPGATVQAVIAGPPDGSQLMEMVGTVADASGRYTLGDLAEGVFDLICTWQAPVAGTAAAAAPRRTARLFGVRVVADQPAGADFRLPVGVSLSGRVLNEDGIPFSEQHSVEYWSLSDGTLSAVALLAGARADLGPDGSFLLTGLDPGPGELRVLAPPADNEHGSHRHRSDARSEDPALPWPRQVGGEAGARVTGTWVVEHAQRLELPDGGLADVVVLQSSDLHRLFEGVVVDASGRLLEGVNVEAFTVSSAAGTTKTSVAGVFRLWLFLPEPERLRLRLTDSRHIPVFVDLSVSSSCSQLGRIVLTAAPTLQLSVIDDGTGEPLPDAIVRWHLHGGSRRETLLAVGPVGVEPVVLRADRTEGRWVLIVEAPGHRPWRRTGEILPTEEATVLTARLVSR